MFVDGLSVISRIWVEGAYGPSGETLSCIITVEHQIQPIKWIIFDFDHLN